MVVKKSREYTTFASVKTTVDNQNLIYQMALNLVPLVGPVVAKNLIAYCGSAEAVFAERLSALKKIPSVGPTIAQNIYNFSDFEVCEKELEFILKNEIETLFFSDSKYPFRLKQIHDAPLLLFKKGTADLNSPRQIGIVGTRKCTAYAKDICRNLVEELAHLNCSIYSGLASGIDTSAHKASLEFITPTVAVVAHGLDRIYPTENRGLSKQITANNGAIITEYMSGTIPDRENFPSRNRIVAGLCDGVIVIESAVKGGSMITAELAFQNDREVFAVPNRVDEQRSGGCHMLIKMNKAHLVENAADVARVFNWDLENKVAPAQTALLLDLPEEQDKIYKYLKNSGPTGLDKLAADFNTSTSKLAIILLELEFVNAVRNLPGKVYEAR